jgi:predicted DNA-binding protein (UPF0251 family)
MERKSQCAPHHEVILRLTEQEVGRKEIARQIGVTHPALSAYMIRLGIPSGGMRGSGIRIDRPEIARLCSLGLTQQQVAQELGCERSTIERAMKKMGLKAARTGPRAGEGHPDWLGGRRLDQKGYVDVLVPLHPLAKKPTGLRF